LQERTPKPAAAILAERVWTTNPLPASLPEPMLLHLGCGDRPLEGFVNVDFLPESPDVVVWDLLARWPMALDSRVSHAFAEDVLEHFFFEEQIYLLAQMNLALRPGGVFRVLMPNLAWLVDVRQKFEPSTDFLSQNFGVPTGADALNLGMRWGGHRWLHDEESVLVLAELCGFAATRTNCETSKVPELTGINLRDESSSLSFAHDLELRDRLTRLMVEPADVSGAIRCGELVSEQPLYRTTHDAARVVYSLPREISTHDIVLVVLRGANLTQQREHNYSSMRFMDEGPVVPIDRSLASTAHSSMLAGPLIRARVDPHATSHILFEPSRHHGDTFSLGPAEIYLRAG